jgi:hypothetical protein
MGKEAYVLAADEDVGNGSLTGLLAEVGCEDAIRGQSGHAFTSGEEEVDGEGLTLDVRSVVHLVKLVDLQVEKRSDATGRKRGPSERLLMGVIRHTLTPLPDGRSSLARRALAEKHGRREKGRLVSWSEETPSEREQQWKGRLTLLAVRAVGFAEDDDEVGLDGFLDDGLDGHVVGVGGGKEMEVRDHFRRERWRISRALGVFFPQRPWTPSEQTTCEED